MCFIFFLLNMIITIICSVVLVRRIKWLERENKRLRIYLEEDVVKKIFRELEIK